MSQELLYTSAPRGLKPGSRGFCTVVTTRGMTTWLIERLESLSGYRHVFLPNDPQADNNPVIWSHLRVPAGGKQYDVLSRVGACGLDYSSRTNKLAHHVVVEPGEQTEAGPAWLLNTPGALQSDWDGAVQTLPHGRSLPQGSLACTVCQQWERLTGDAGWAGVVAEAFLADPHRLVYLVFEPGQNLLPLLVEVQSLLPPAVRWQVTFSTYYTGLPQDIPCAWRCVLKGSEEARMARRFPQSLLLDLTAPLQKAAGGALVEAARTGVLPVVAVAVAAVAGNESVAPEEPQVVAPELPAAGKEPADDPGEYALRGGVVEGGPPPIPIARRGKTKRRRKWLWGGLVTAAVLLVAATTYFWWSSQGGGTAGNSRLVAQQEVSGKKVGGVGKKRQPRTPSADVSEQTDINDGQPKDGTPLPVGQALASTGSGGIPPKGDAEDGGQGTEMPGRGTSALRTPSVKAEDSAPATPEVTTTPGVVPETSKPQPNAPNKKNAEVKPGEDTSKPPAPNPLAKPQAPPPRTTPPKKPEIPVHYAGFMHHKDFNKLGDGFESITDLRVICSGDSLSCKTSGSKDIWTLYLKVQTEQNVQSEQAIARCGMLENKASRDSNAKEVVFAFKWLNNGKNIASGVIGGALLEIKTGKTTHVYALWEPISIAEASLNDLFGDKLKSLGPPSKKKQSLDPDMDSVIATTLSRDLDLKFKNLTVQFDNVDFVDWHSQTDSRNLISNKLKRHLSADTPERFDKNFKRAVEWYYNPKSKLSGGSSGLIVKKDVQSLRQEVFKGVQNFTAVCPVIVINDKSNPVKRLGKIVLNSPENFEGDFFKIFFNASNDDIGSIKNIVSAVSAQRSDLSQAEGNRKLKDNIQKFIENAQKFIIAVDQHRFQNTAMVKQLTVSTVIKMYEVDLIRIK